MGDPSVLEVFADVACPFTHVGLRRFVEQREERGRPDVILRIRAWPLEVVNGAPLDPDFIAEEVAEIQRQVAPDLFLGFSRSAFPKTTLPAFAVAAAAYRHGDRKGEAVSLALRTLVFEDGVDVGDPTVMEAFAAAHDLHVTAADHRAATDDHREGTARGVVGSPHFFTATEGFFCPALDVSRDARGDLHVTPDESGFERFMSACLMA